jgi:hypothetical protein
VLPSGKSENKGRVGTIVCSRIRLLRDGYGLEEEDKEQPRDVYLAS